MVSDTCFQNSDFNLKAQILSLATNTVSCFPWSDRLTSFFFGKMSAKYSSLNNHSFFQAEIYFILKKWQVQLSATAQQDSPPLRYTAEPLYACFVTHNVKETRTQGLQLNKINSFSCFIQGISKWRWLFSPFSVHAWEWRNVYQYGLLPLLWFVWRFQQSYQGFFIICVNVNTVKKIKK